MKKYKPILFNTEMVKAILDGMKTVTRRVVKPQPESNCVPIIAESFGKLELQYNGGVYAFPYQPGDILYVRETWAYLSDWIPVDPDVGIFDGYIYKADWDNSAKKAGHPKWKPSIYMPKEAARIFLRVTNVSVARLQDMTENDVAKEGAEHLIKCPIEHATYDKDGVLGDMCWNTGYCSPCEYINKSNAELFGEYVWNNMLKKQEINKYGWSANPCVWVISFERVDKPENF